MRDVLIEKTETNINDNLLRFERVEIINQRHIFVQVSEKHRRDSLKKTQKRLI
jgi:hypothetical protein